MYYIYVTRENEEVGSVAYDGNITSDFDNVMKFETEAEAEKWIENHKSEFFGNCSFNVCEA